MDDTLKYHIRHSVKGCKALDTNRRLAQAIQYAQADFPKTTSSRMAKSSSFFSTVATKVNDIDSSRAWSEKRLRDAIIKMLGQSSLALNLRNEENQKKARKAIIALENEISLFCQVINHLYGQFEELETNERSKKALVFDSTSVPQAIYTETVLKMVRKEEQSAAGALDAETEDLQSMAPSTSKATVDAVTASMSALMLDLNFMVHPHYVSYLLDQIDLCLTPLENYKLMGEFGRGGQGRVHRAKLTAEDGDTVVALKVEPITKYTFKIIIREMMFISDQQLKHPNIVTFLHKCSIFAVKTDYYMALAFEPMTDGSLCRYICHFWPEPQIACVMQQMLHALSYIHSKGIVHNDIKSANILLHIGTVKMADFGHAMHEAKFNSEITGTVRWAAPELIQANMIRDKSNKNLTVAADIWSLGATLYELLENKYPFYQYNNVVVPDAIVTHGLALSEKEIYSDVVKNFFSKMTKKNPTKRPSAESLLTDLFMEKTCTLSELADFIDEKKMIKN